MAGSEHAVPISLDRLNRVLLPIGEASGLPNAAYVDEGYFYYERDQVIGRTWAGLAFAGFHSEPPVCPTGGVHGPPVAHHSRPERACCACSIMCAVTAA